MHEQSIIDTIVGQLETTDCKVKAISLVCDEVALRERLQKDIDNGIRMTDVMERSIARIPLYSQLNTIKLDTTEKSISQVCEELTHI